MRTKTFIMVIFAAAVIGNLILIATGNPSESSVIQNISGKWPIVPFAVGVFIGHVFWPVGGLKK